MSKKDLILKKLFVNVILILIIAFIANPQKQLAKARNSAREYGARRVISALKVYASPNHNGQLPPEIETLCPNTQTIGKSGVDLEVILRNFFFKDFPYDPQYGNKNDTGYKVCLAPEGKIKVLSNYGENSKTIFIEE